MAARQVVYGQDGVAVSTINGLLKDDYVLEQIQEQVNKSTYFLDRLKSQKTTHGRQFIFPVELAVSQGVGSRGENGALPDAGFAEYEQATGNVKYLYSSLYITGPSIEATAGSKAAFADALKQALKTTREAMKLDLQRQVWGNGSGVIASVEVTATGTGTPADPWVIAVYKPHGLAYSGALEAGQKTRLFKRNMTLHFSGGAIGTVAGVSADGKIRVVRVAGAAPAKDETIVRGDSATSTSAGKEIEGLTKIVGDTGTYLGIDRTNRPEWQANILDAGGALTEAKMRIAADTAEINGVGSYDMILTDHVTRRRYETLLQSQKRFVNPMKLEGGHSALDFDGKPLLVDKDAPAERMYFLDSSAIVWMMMKDIDWMQRDGAVLTRVQGKDAYEATLYTYRNLACHRPVNQTVLEGINA